MRYWPMRVETAEEVVEVLMEAKHDRAETCRLVTAEYVRAGYGPIVLVLDPAVAPSFAQVAAAYPGRRPLLLTIGPEPVEAPAGPRGRVTPLADVVARN